MSTKSCHTYLEYGEGSKSCSNSQPKSDARHVRTLSIQSLPVECASEAFIKQTAPQPSLIRQVVVFALRRESPASSSGMKVLSVLENIDKRYVL